MAGSLAVAIPGDAQPSPGSALPSGQTRTTTSGDRVVEERELVIEVYDLDIPSSSLDQSVVESQTGSQVELTLAADVLFAFNRATLTSAARSRLRTVAARLRRVSGAVQVDGYTDSTGSQTYNIRLSRRRAEAVRRALMRLLRGRRIRYVVAGRGEAEPVAANTKPDGSDNPRGRARNRRVAVTFTR